MADISVGIYSIRIYDSKGNEDIQVEDNSYGISLSKLIKDYFKIMERRARVYQKEQSMIIIDKILENNNSFISGIIKTGEFGYETEFYDAVNNEKTEIDNDGDEVITEGVEKKYTKPKEMASVLPFVFSFYLTDHKNKKLYIALQRFGQFGIKIKIKNELNKFLRLKYPEYPNLKIELHDLISEKVISSSYRKEGIKSLKFTRYELPEDFADKIRNNGSNPKDFMVEYVIKSKKKGLKLPLFHSIDKFFSSTKKNIHNIIEIKHNKELEYDNVHADLMVNGKTKTLDFSNFLKFKVYEILNIEKEENGFPNSELLLEEMKNKLKEAIDSIELL